MIQNIDIGYFIIGIIGLWLLAEIWSVLRQILYELNPKKRPLKRLPSWKWLLGDGPREKRK